jgi:hypothetical protein
MRRDQISRTNSAVATATSPKALNMEASTMSRARFACGECRRTASSSAAKEVEWRFAMVRPVNAASSKRR